MTFEWGPDGGERLGRQLPGRRALQTGKHPPARVSQEYASKSKRLGWLKHREQGESNWRDGHRGKCAGGEAMADHVHLIGHSRTFAQPEMGSIGKF